MILNTVYKWLAITALLIALAGFGLWQYGRAAKAGVQVEILGSTISQAASERKADLKADAKVAQKNRVALDSASRAAVPARKYVRQNPESSQGVSAGPVPDPEWSRVFNAALDGSREAVRATRSMP